MEGFDSMDTQSCDDSSVVKLLSVVKCCNSEADCLKVLRDEIFDNVKFSILPAASKCEIPGLLLAAPKTQENLHLIGQLEVRTCTEHYQFPYFDEKVSNNSNFNKHLNHIIVS